jgi:hypothetical protein
MAYIEEIKIENESIIIHLNCRNNDKKKIDLLNYLNEFKENLINNVLCHYDNKTRFNENNFLYCRECKIIFCNNCQRDHDKGENLNHKIIGVKYLDFFCFEHDKYFDNFCLECQKNLCSKCLNTHRGHKIIKFNDKIFNVEKIDEYIAKFEQNNILLSRLEVIINTTTNLSRFFQSFNPYRTKFFYLNDLLLNILKIYKFEKNNNNMNFELLYNLLFVINNINSLNIDIEDFKKNDTIEKIKKFGSNKNNYPLEFNNQKKTKNFLYNKYGIEDRSGRPFDYFEVFNDYSSTGSEISFVGDKNNIKLNKKNVFLEIKKIISIGAENMNSKFCFSCYSNLDRNKYYLIYNDLYNLVKIYSCQKEKNIRMLKNNNNESVSEKVISFKVFTDIVKNENIIIFSSIYKNNGKEYNKLKIYGTNNYKLQNELLFDDLLNDFTFYNLGEESFIALNEKGKNELKIYYKDGRSFDKKIGFIKDVQFLESYDRGVGLKQKIYLLITGNNYLKSYDMNNYKLYKKYNNDDKDSYIFSKFYITKDKIYIITSLKNGILKKIDFDNPNNIEIINTEKNGNFINCFCFLNVNYLFASTEDKKIKIIELNEKKILNTYAFSDKITSLDIKVSVKNSSKLYVYDKEGNIFEYIINQQFN